MIVTKDLEAFLENTSDQDVQLQAGELFGFGLGSYTETPLGRVFLISTLSIIYSIYVQVRH